MNILKAIFRLLKPFLQKTSDHERMVTYQTILKKVDSYSRQDQDIIRSECLILTKKQLIELLIDAGHKFELRRNQLEEWNDDIRMEIVQKMLSAEKVVEEGDLQTRLEVTGDCLGTISDCFNTLISEFNEALDYLPDDHHLLKKYRLKKSS